MLTTNIVVLDSGTILGAGLAVSLAKNEGFQVHCIAFRDMAALIHALKDRRPDVIILTEESPLDIVRLLDLLEVIPTSQRLRVMLIRQDDNIVDLYDKRQVMISHSQDVIKLVHRPSVSD